MDDQADLRTLTDRHTYYHHTVNHKRLVKICSFWYDIAWGRLLQKGSFFSLCLIVFCTVTTHHWFSTKNHLIRFIINHFKIEELWIMKPTSHPIELKGTGEERDAHFSTYTIYVWFFFFLLLKTVNTVPWKAVSFKRCWGETKYAYLSGYSSLVSSRCKLMFLPPPPQKKMPVILQPLCLLGLLLLLDLVDHPFSSFLSCSHAPYIQE